jgi:hypothetical protein
MFHSMKIRQQVLLSAQQVAFLQQETARLGVSMSEVVRRVLDAHREAREAREVRGSVCRHARAGQRQAGQDAAA